MQITTGLLSLSFKLLHEKCRLLLSPNVLEASKEAGAVTMGIGLVQRILKQKTFLIECVSLDGQAPCCRGENGSYHAC